MKKIISILCVLALVGGTAFAQKHQWREKVRAEQVSFLSSELELSEAEAQAFWPVYNDIQSQRREAFKASGEAFKALKEAQGKDVENLLDAYLAAKKKAESVDEQALARYKKVLPIEKVAKLVVAEEKFRHRQIGRLGGKGGHKPGKL